jgi:hypothetical protein
MVSILRQGIVKAMEEIAEADAAVVAEAHHHPSPAA